MNRHIIVFVFSPRQFLHVVYLFTFRTPVLPAHNKAENFRIGGVKKQKDVRPSGFYKQVTLSGGLSRLNRYETAASLHGNIYSAIAPPIPRRRRLEAPLTRSNNRVMF